MKNYIYLLILAISTVTLPLKADQPDYSAILFEMNEEERGLFVDHLQNPTHSYTLEWISDKGDEIIISDGSRWALDTTSFLAQGKNWELGDKIAFAHLTKKMSNLIAFRVGSIMGCFAALIEKSTPEKGITIAYINRKGTRITLSDGSKWETTGISDVARNFQVGDVVMFGCSKGLLFDDLQLINQTRFPFVTYIMPDKSKN